MNTGTCLCGAIAWEANMDPLSVHYCHCGMCRRWTGSPFATLAWYPRASIRWRGAAPVVFRSSPLAIRAHCGMCGTPLYMAYDARDELALTVGSMDAADSVEPTHHYGCEGRLSWVDINPQLPAKRTQEAW
jgi:hypothetical protein